MAATVLTQRVFEIDVAGCVQLLPEAATTIFTGWPSVHNTMTPILSALSFYPLTLQYQVLSNTENGGRNVYTKYFATTVFGEQMLLGSTSKKCIN